MAETVGLWITEKVQEAQKNRVKSAIFSSNASTNRNMIKALFARNKSVAYPRLCNDVARMLRVRFDFSAQLSDEDA